MKKNTVLFARQPIFDADLSTYAYELLFRPANTVKHEEFDGDHATSQVMLNAFTELPIQQVLEGKLAFVNFTRNLILNPPQLDQKDLVIEVLEDIHFDEEMIQGIKALKKKGYIIALDDFVYDASLAPVVRLADIVKVDVLVHDMDELRQQVKALAKFKVKLLAEKVEDHEMFETCKKLGFDYFQGYFLSKPQLIEGKKATESKQSAMQLIAKLQSPDIEIGQIVSAIALDPILSFKLLKLINSSMFSFASEVDSINQAVTLLGLSKIKSWATLLVLANAEDKPQSLAISAINRARFCQLLGEQFADKSQSSETYFTVGLLSQLDAFLNMTMEELLADLSLTPAINEAISSYAGTLGLALASATLYEQADWEKINWDALEKFNIGATEIEEYYINSIAWGQTLLTQI